MIIRFKTICRRAFSGVNDKLRLVICLIFLQLQLLQQVKNTKGGDCFVAYLIS